MKTNAYVVSVFCLLLSFFLFSCVTSQSHGIISNEGTRNINDKVTKARIKKSSFGGDKEIQAYVLDNKVYYMLNIDKNILDKDIGLYSIDTNRVNAKEVTIDGIDGIVLTFYDIKIFLEETKSSCNTRVGIFEPSSNRWIIGYDKNRDVNAIGFTYNKEEIGPVIINRSSISRAYN